VVILGIFLITSYNSLVKYRNWVEESWSQIDVQLKRRHDLIPNLVNTVKGYRTDRKSTRLNSSHVSISYAVFCLKIINAPWFWFSFFARPHSRLMISWIAIARRTDSSVGVVIASSYALVWRLVQLSYIAINALSV